MDLAKQKAHSNEEMLENFLKEYKELCVLLEHQETAPFSQYDVDTCQGTPNFPKGKYAVNVGKKEYMGYIHDEFVKVPEDGYYTYEFALVNNGKVIAIGNEQGRCGGVTHSCRDKDFEDRLKKSPVYDKVKHLPIATEDGLEEPIYRHFNSYMEYEKYMRKNTKK